MAIAAYMGGRRGGGNEGSPSPSLRRRNDMALVATDDRMIPPPAQRQMAERAGADIVEAGGSHAIYVSKPEAVVEVIERAASLAM